MGSTSPAHVLGCHNFRQAAMPHVDCSVFELELHGSRAPATEQNSPRFRHDRCLAVFGQRTRPLISTAVVWFPDKEHSSHCVLSYLDMCSVGGSNVDGPSSMSVYRCLHERLMHNHAEIAKPLSDFGHDPSRSGDLSLLHSGRGSRASTAAANDSQRRAATGTGPATASQPDGLGSGNSWSTPSKPCSRLVV